MKKKCDMLPANIQKKIDADKTLTAADHEIINGLEEAKKALELPREERRPLEFKEEHELLMTFHGEINLNDNVDTDEDNNDDEEKEDNRDGEDDEVDPEPEVKQSPVKKRKKKRPKETASQEDPTTTPAKKSRKTKGHVSHTDFAEKEEDDESDHNIDYNDDDDEEEEYQDSQYDDKDDKDEDFEDDTTAKKRKRASSASGKKTKKKKAQQQQQQQQQGADDVGAQDEPKSRTKQHKLNRARTKRGSASNSVKDAPERDKMDTKPEKQRTPGAELKNWKGRAQRNFARNERNMLPIMEKLDSAIEKKDAAVIDAILKDIRANQIRDLVNSFILGYDIVGKIKSCKGVIGKSENYKATMANMKAHFEGNIGNEPPDFQPVKNEKGGVKNNVTKDIAGPAATPQTGGSRKRTNADKVKTESAATTTTTAPASGSGTGTPTPKPHIKRESNDRSTHPMSTPSSASKPEADAKTTVVKREGTPDPIKSHDGHVPRRVKSTGSIENPSGQKPSPLQKVKKTASTGTIRPPKQHPSLKQMLGANNNSNEKQQQRPPVPDAKTGTKPTRVESNGSVGKTKPPTKKSMVRCEWLKEFVTKDGHSLGTNHKVEESDDNTAKPMDESRAMAVEFFDEACREVFASFPEVNIDAASRALESGVFEASSNNSERPYWKTVHLVIGAMTGKQGKGGLADALLAGKYEKPVDVGRLRDRQLMELYAGEEKPKPSYRG